MGNPENTHIGRAAEEECPGALNAGMFAAMVEAGDVMGVFVGHESRHRLRGGRKGHRTGGYGRFSGDDTTYNNLRHGVRVLVLTEGERGWRRGSASATGVIVDRGGVP